jgi:transcriptional regulator with XRE-family HTH domain
MGWWLSFLILPKTCQGTILIYFLELISYICQALKIPYAIFSKNDNWRKSMDFPKTLVALRKGKKLTQQKLADIVGVHVIQIRRYESGSAQPTLEVIKKLSIALCVSADKLIFGENGRGPDEDLRLQFEAISKFNAKEKQVIKEVLEGLILKHEAKRWATTSQVDA